MLEHTCKSRKEKIIRNNSQQSRYLSAKNLFKHLEIDQADTSKDEISHIGIGDSRDRIAEKFESLQTSPIILQTCIEEDENKAHEISHKSSVRGSGRKSSTKVRSSKLRDRTKISIKREQIKIPIVKRDKENYKSMVDLYSQSGATSLFTSPMMSRDSFGDSNFMKNIGVNDAHIEASPTLCDKSISLKKPTSKTLSPLYRPDSPTTPSTAYLILPDQFKIKDHNPIELETKSSSKNKRRVIKIRSDSSISKINVVNDLQYRSLGRGLGRNSYGSGSAFGMSSFKPATNFGEVSGYGSDIYTPQSTLDSIKMPDYGVMKPCNKEVELQGRIRKQNACDNCQLRNRELLLSAVKLSQSDVNDVLGIVTHRMKNLNIQAASASDSAVDSEKTTTPGRYSPAILEDTYISTNLDESTGSFLKDEICSESTTSNIRGSELLSPSPPTYYQTAPQPKRKLNKPNSIHVYGRNNGNISLGEQSLSPSQTSSSEIRSLPIHKAATISHRDVAPNSQLSCSAYPHQFSDDQTWGSKTTQNKLDKRDSRYGSKNNRRSKSDDKRIERSIGNKESPNEVMCHRNVSFGTRNKRKVIKVKSRPSKYCIRGIMLSIVLASFTLCKSNKNLIKTPSRKPIVKLL